MSLNQVIAKAVKSVYDSKAGTKAPGTKIAERVISVKNIRIAPLSK